jgi:CBS domain-containing protein
MRISERIIQGPVLSVRADQSIEESVALMRTRKVGALLIVSPNDTGELVGIFTERDLLERIGLIHSTDTWVKPIQHVMTKNPRTVTLKDLHQVPGLMVRIGIRHVPVVEIVRGKKRPIGVVSMRDCFRWLYDSGVVDSVFNLLPTEFSAIAKLRPLGIISKNDSLRKIIDASFGTELKIQNVDASEHLGQGTPVPDLRGLSALIVDLDGETAKDWILLLRRLNKASMPPIVVCYDPAKHSDMEKVLLQQLKASNRFHVFPKPIHLVEFIAVLSKIFSQKSK